MERVFFDYSKLRGRIAEKCGSQKEYARRLGITGATLSKKLNGITYFSQPEIERSKAILGIEPGQVSAYFFAEKI